MKKSYIETLSDIVSQPTASFRENAVIERVENWAKHRSLPAKRDACGNILIHYRNGGPGVDWVFSAHMDHPAFVVTRRCGNIVWADFRGGIAERYFHGAPVVFYTKTGEIKAIVRNARRRKDTGWWQCRLELEREVPVARGTVGGWDVPVFRMKKSRITARACDDLVGVAGILCALDKLIQDNVKTRVTALFTRAEEVGFIGAMAACRHGSIARTAQIVAIETSKAMPGAALGGGVVIRAGDYSWTFDPELTNHLRFVAKREKERNKRFRYTCQLMPGGTCESTAYSMFGYTATGLCIPLGNYHNQGARNKVASEHVHTDDFSSLIDLLVAVAKDKSSPKDTALALKERLYDRLARRSAYLSR